MRIGIDLGGTKIEALALDDEGRECARERIPTPRERYQDVVEAIASLVLDLERRLGQQGSVGVGIPGTISPATGLVKGGNTQMLNGQALDQDLGRRLQRPVRVANDANCFALSEATDGAGAPPANWDGRRPWVVFGVIIGTGTGGGLVSDGRVLVGPDGVTGEWGHIPLPWPDPEDPAEWPLPACWCGRRGCVELFLSGTGLAREHERRTGAHLRATEIAARAEAGDAQAEATMQRYEHRLARGLATLISTINPDVIVLGGGVSKIARLYRNVPELWQPFAFSDVVTTRLLPAAHGDSSGVRGAAWLWPAART